MPRLGKKEKEEWAYFINDIGRRQYNERYRQCVHECKQSYTARSIRAKGLVPKPSAFESEIHPSHKS